MVAIRSDDKTSSNNFNKIKDTVMENVVINDFENQINYDYEINSDKILQKILQSPKIHEILKSYHDVNKKLEASIEKENHRAAEIVNQQTIIDNLKEEITKIRLNMLELEKARKQDLTTIVNQMHYNVNKCCRRSFVDIERYVMGILKDLFGMPNHVATQNDASDWLRSLFIAKDDLEIRLENLTKQFNHQFNSLISSNSKNIMDQVAIKITKELNGRRAVNSAHGDEVVLESVSDDRIREIVKNTLAIYDADKTGLVDYAMEPSGGQILSIRCTETYNTGTAVVSVLGIPLWYPVNTPRTVITPGIKPGECWAFQNFPGFLIIKLVQPIKIEMFSYEHISKTLVPNGRIDSAPKQFTIYGLRNENDKDPFEIGRYTYDVNGEPLQYFPVHNNSLIFSIVELVIHNNHGNPNYSCLYRFRVHGTPSTEPS